MNKYSTWQSCLGLYIRSNFLSGSHTHIQQGYTNTHCSFLLFHSSSHSYNNLSTFAHPKCQVRVCWLFSVYSVKIYLCIMTVVVWFWYFSLVFVLCPFSMSLVVKIIVNPSCANLFTIANPIPLFAPVTIATISLDHHLHKIYIYILRSAITPAITPCLSSRYYTLYIFILKRK